ncbi:MipA/OmpV family protein [Litorimonas haliclonae]|uniref:MipA/OmpV family protein n=1 Tax=Litorimonas haliclonae TaxID=2081977 RepID=UPI0039EF9EA2
MKFLSLILGTTALWSVAAFAEAQTSIFDIPPDKAESTASIGIAGVSLDSYVGSEETDLLVLPYVNATYKGRFFLNPALGAGVYAINNDKLRLGAAANVAFGRDGKDTPFGGTSYEEAFDVSTGGSGKVFARANLPFAALDVVGTVPIGADHDGAKLDTLLTTLVKPTDRFTLTPGVRATFSTGDLLDTNYGIDSRQAAASGLAPLSNDDGLSSLGAHIAGYYELNEDYEIVGLVNHTWLMGDIKESPLSPKNTGLTVALGIARKF